MAEIRGKRKIFRPGRPDRFGDAVRAWLGRDDRPGIRTLSLFSGAGGLDIGFSDVGFDIVASVEIEEKFCETLEMNTGEGRRFPNSRVNCIDIREFTGGGLGPIDFMIGGPPCQPFSAAGRRANGVMGTEDARGGPVPRVCTAPDRAFAEGISV